MIWIFCIFLAFLLIYEPIFGYFDFQKLKKVVQTDEHARMNYYHQTLWGLWIPTVVILLLIGFTDIRLKDIGIALPTWQPNVLGLWISIIAVGIGICYLFLILYMLISFYLNPSFKEKFIQQQKQSSENIQYAEILPVSSKEKKRWGFISLTAGVTEEVIYRGFLFYMLAFLLPNSSIWLLIIAASILFGLAHSYQGFWLGVIRTSVIGGIFCCIYLSIGSILPLIALHFLIDYVAKLDE